MRWADKAKTALKVNDWLTLDGIPAEAHGYRLGSRSALDWVVEMYRPTEDKRSGIQQDPNRADDPEYIVRLVGQVARVVWRRSGLWVGCRRLSERPSETEAFAALSATGGGALLGRGRFLCLRSCG